MWLDLSEIPSARAPSPDTEAFEKFAKQFFEELFVGTIKKTAGRGPDGRADIIVEVNSEKWLISCKHWLHTTVSANDEKDPRGRLDQHDCDKFVGFYSCGPTNGLNAALAGIRTNHPSFKFEIFNNEDIVAKILSFANARGWLLAARWFPKSYAKLFSQLVYPIDHYKDSDVVVHDDGSAVSRVWAGSSPLVALVSSNEEHLNKARKIALHVANERVTSKAFGGIFVNRIAEFAALFPGSFVRMRLVPDNDLGPYNIFPSWNMKTLSDQAIGRDSRQSAFAICRVWSLWDAHEATEYLNALRMLCEIPRPDIPEHISTARDARSLYDAIYGPGSSAQFLDLSAKLTLGDIAAECGTLERGYYAGLLCFMPGVLRSRPDPHRMAVALAEQLGERELLNERLDRITEMFRPADEEYVRRTSPTLCEKLISVHAIDPERKFANILEPGLRCFQESGTEPWAPSARMSAELAGIFTGTL